MRKHCRSLDASVEASGPHDFAVRDMRIRLMHCRVHRIPRPTSVTIAKRPSWRARDGEACRNDLPDGESEKFFADGLDRPRKSLVKLTPSRHQMISNISQRSFHRGIQAAIMRATQLGFAKVIA
jgi:hypothetical protein